MTMTIEETLREDLRAWMKSPPIGLPEYSADLIVQRRVGKMLATSNSKFLSQAHGKSVASSIQTRLPDKP